MTKVNIKYFFYNQYQSAGTFPIINSLFINHLTEYEKLFDKIKNKEPNRYYYYVTSINLSLKIAHEFSLEVEMELK